MTRMENISPTSNASWKEVLFQLSPDMLCIANLEGFFLEVNPAFEETLGYTQKQLLGQPFLNLIHEEDVQATLDEMAKLSQGIKTLHFENRYKTGQGTYKWLSWKATPVPEEGLIYALARDITQRKKMEDDLKASMIALEKANKELDEFAYIVSHDLRAPLRGISSLAEFIEEDLGDSAEEEIISQLRLMKERVSKMNELITGILNYSRVGKDKIPVGRTDLHKLVEDICNSISPPESIQIVIEGNLPILETKEILINQVFSNLINNAIKYHHPSGGHITISCKELKTEWQFNVEDDGPGIDPKYHDTIFGIFKSANSKDSQKGTGIGLALVKKIVESEGGKISLISEPGQGSTFSFTLPKSRV